MKELKIFKALNSAKLQAKIAKAIVMFIAAIVTASLKIMTKHGKVMEAVARDKGGMSSCFTQAYGISPKDLLSRKIAYRFAYLYMLRLGRKVGAKELTAFGADCDSVFNKAIAPVRSEFLAIGAELTKASK